MAELDGANAQLSAALSSVRQRRAAAQLLWNDSVFWDFQQSYGEQMEAQAQATLQEMARLAEVIAAARRKVQ